MEKKKRHNGSKSKYLIKSTNFGPHGDPIRGFVEDMEKKIGKQEFSRMMKTAFTLVYVDEKNKERYAIKSLKLERITLLEEMQMISHKLRINFDQLVKLGEDENDIESVIPK